MLPGYLNFGIPFPGDLVESYIFTKHFNAHKTGFFYQIIPTGNRTDKTEKWRYFARPMMSMLKR